MLDFPNPRILSAFLLAAAIGSLCPAAAQAPRLRMAEVQDVAPLRYRAELDLDPAKDTFTGLLTIQLQVNKPARAIWLNASKITVAEASATAGGKTWTAKALPGGDDFLGLQFDSPVPAGAAELRIRYTGQVRHGDSSGIFDLQDNGNRYLYTQFEATDARDAFPCFDEPGYKTPWQLTLRVPAADSAVSNTPAVSEKAAGGVKTYVFAETKPLPAYLIAFAVGPFDFVDAGVSGKNRVPVRIVTPKGRAGEAKYAAEVTATILTRLEQYFGIPFPYEKSDQVSVPITVGFGAMENPGMVTYGQNIILASPATDTIARRRSYASVAAHELAHQWFGDLVTTAWWDDIWLNEAFATWMEQKLVAEWQPEWKTRIDDVNAKLGAIGSDSLVSARKIRQAIDTKDDINNAFDGITYQKGAAVIGMFENWMGAEEFRKGVQSYLNRYANRTTTAGDFLDSLSSSSKKDVTRPFSTFLNQAGVPVLSMALDCGKKPPTLHVAQSRLVPLGSKGSAERVWSVPICVRYDGSAAPECTLITQEKQDVALKNAKACPAWLNGNANAQGYYLVDYQGGLLAALTKEAGRLTPSERVDLIGNATAMAGAGKLPPADALRLVEAFHNDPEREVVQKVLNVALGPRTDLVPPALLPNYQRFLTKNFQTRARELGWLPRPGESDDARLLRPVLLGAVARFGGDAELAAQAKSLASKWLDDPSSLPPEIAASVLSTAAHYGDLALFQRYLAALRKTQDRQEKQRLLSAMRDFHDPAAISAALQAVLKKDIPLTDGFTLLIGAGQAYPDTRRMPFEFIKAHLDELMVGKPSIFGNDLGSYLPSAGGSFCDAKSRDDLRAFFRPIVDRYAGAPRNLAQVLESIDLCIARKAAQEPSVKSFLASIQP